MKFLFDQNISHRILEKLSDHFKESTSVKKEGLINSPDYIASGISVSDVNQLRTDLITSAGPAPGIVSRIMYQGY